MKGSCQLHDATIVENVLNKVNRRLNAHCPLYNSAIPAQCVVSDTNSWWYHIPTSTTHYLRISALHSEHGFAKEHPCPPGWRPSQRSEGAVFYFWTLITCRKSMFDHSCTVAVKDMVSASNLWMTSLHKLEPEQEIKWLERFTVFNLLLAAIYTSSFTSIDTLWGLLVETLSLPSVRTSSRRFLSAVSAKACWVPTICASLCVYIYTVYTCLYIDTLWTSLDYHIQPLYCVAYYIH